MLLIDFLLGRKRFLKRTFDSPNSQIYRAVSNNLLVSRWRCRTISKSYSNCMPTSSCLFSLSLLVGSEDNCRRLPHYWRFAALPLPQSIELLLYYILYIIYLFFKRTLPVRPTISGWILPDTCLSLSLHTLTRRSLTITITDIIIIIATSHSQNNNMLALSLISFSTKHSRKIDHGSHYT